MGPVAVDPSCQGQGIGKLLLDFPETVSDNVVIGKGKRKTALERLNTKVNINTLYFPGQISLFCFDVHSSSFFVVYCIIFLKKYAE